MNSSQFTFPWPPTVNHYYARRKGSPGLYVAEPGTRFRAVVRRVVGSPRTMDGRVGVAFDCYPPDNRRRDLDNINKCLLDAMEKAKVYGNDDQIDLLIMQRIATSPPGSVIANVFELPIDICPLCGSEKNV